MRSAWVDSDAKQAVDYWVKAGIGAELARRVYSTRLLGRDRKLVLHGGGNTSVKTRVRDLLGADTEVLCVKGSGWDMASIEPAGMPAVRLGALRGLRARTALPDEEMVRVQRAALIDPQAPNPSVETLLHAFLPHKFVDHTHATAILSLIDQADSEALCKETFGARLGFVPYIMPGFALAKKAAAVFEKNSAVEGLILDKHGIVTFGDDAREAYGPNRASDRHRTDHQRRLHAARCLRRRCAQAADRRFPQQRSDSQLRQWQRGCALRPCGTDHARSCDPHRTLAADRAGAGSRQARRFQECRAAGRARVHGRLRRLFHAPKGAGKRRPNA